MAENPTTLMPDFGYQWNLQELVGHNTLKKRTPTGREQRMGYYPTSGYPVFVGDTTPLNQKDRATLRDFYNSVRGELLPFYWYKTMHENFTNLNLGTITAVSAFLIPFKKVVATLDTTPALLTLTVAGVSKAFTITENAGTYGEAQINISGGAATGTVLMTFAGRPQQVGRFDADEFTESFMQNAASIKSSIKIRIQGL